MKKYKIYLLRDPELEEVKYIGATSEKYINSRLNGHIKEAFREGDSRSKSDKSCWIKSLVSKNLKPEIHILEEVDEDKWEEKEIYYINWYKETGHRLFNIAKGGKDFTYLKGRKQTLEHIKNAQWSRCKPRKKKDLFGIKKKVPIEQYTLDGKFIKEYPSALDAYKETGIWKESIRNCMNKRSKSAGKYMWKYKNKKEVSLCV